MRLAVGDKLIVMGRPFYPIQADLEQSQTFLKVGKGIRAENRDMGH